MKASLTITDLTRMQGDRVCVAGYLSDNTCVRPVFAKGGLTEEWLRVRERSAIRPFAVIEFDMQTPSAPALPPHTEDRIIDPVHRVRRGAWTPEEQWDWLARVDDGGVARIFGATIYQEGGAFILAGEGTRSLGTVRVARMDDVQFNPLDNGRWNYRLTFSDQTGKRYRLPVTDLAFRSYLNYLRDQCGIAPQIAAEQLTTTFQSVPVFLRIGLARGWERFPDRCYVQITGVYSFPDYLSGRCFADFAPTTEPISEGLFAKLSRYFRA